MLHEITYQNSNYFLDNSNSSYYQDTHLEAYSAKKEKKKKPVFVWDCGRRFWLWSSEQHRHRNQWSKTSSMLLPVTEFSGINWLVMPASSSSSEMGQDFTERSDCNFSSGKRSWILFSFFFFFLFGAGNSWIFFINLYMNE